MWCMINAVYVSNLRVKERYVTPHLIENNEFCKCKVDAIELRQRKITGKHPFV